MNTYPETICRLGLTAEQLSAWRDDALSAAEQRQLRAHIPTCAACRSQLATYDMLATALREERAPQPDARLWSAIYERIAAQADPAATRAAVALPPNQRQISAELATERYPSPSRIRHPRRALWSGLSALAAAILLMAGFVALFNSHRAGTSVGAKATATPPTGSRLSWLQGTLPPQYVGMSSSSIVPAPSDGNTAYACGSQQPGSNADSPTITTQVWDTHDHAIRWSPTAAISAQGPFTRCGLVVDAFDPSIVAISFYTETQQRLTFITDNGGASWQPTSNQFFELATGHGATYALVAIYPQMNGKVRPTTQLELSTDGLHSWQPLAQNPLGSDGFTQQFWLNPFTGDLLAQVSPPTFVAPFSIGLPGQLWSSQNGGHSWLLLHNVTAQYHVQAPRADQPWRLCYFDLESSGQQRKTPINAVTCSADGGQNWQRRSLNNPDGLFLEQAIALTSDGSLLIRAGRADGGSSNAALYRLAWNANAWQQVGTLPGVGDWFTYASTLHMPIPGGVVWDVPLNAIPTSVGAPSAAIYTAAYS